LRPRCAPGAVSRCSMPTIRRGQPARLRLAKIMRWGLPAAASGGWLQCAMRRLPAVL
jgi:hypothetical protein